MFEDYILIQKIKNGDQNAFERVLEKYYHSIYFYCVRRCYGNVELAADLTQDIFLKVIKNIRNYRFTGKFYKYLFKSFHKTTLSFSNQSAVSGKTLRTVCFE